MRNRRLAIIAAVMSGPLASAAIAAPAAAETFEASMSGRQEVPKGDRDGRGSAQITTNAARGRVCFEITLRRVGTVTAGHIHRGRAGKAGPVVVELFARSTRAPRGCATGVAKDTIRRIERNPGAHYVNVHNRRHPAGAVRGQLKERGISY